MNVLLLRYCDCRRWDGHVEFFGVSFGAFRESGALCHHFVLQAHESFDERFGTGWAAWDVDIDGYDHVHAFDDMVAVFEVGSAADGACSHCDDIFGIGHLFVETAES